MKTEAQKKEIAEKKAATKAALAATEARRKAIEKVVEAIFSTSYYASVEELRPGGFNIVVREHDTSFDDLQAVSNAFGTKNINMGSERRDDGYCDTCSYPYSVNVIRVDGYTRVGKL